MLLIMQGVGDVTPDELCETVINEQTDGHETCIAVWG